MAANYVPITREEMEEYLREISRRLKATVMRKAGTEGVYALALNPFVGVRISTSLGQTESVVGVGKGAINVCLMGIQGERGWRSINGKAGNKSRVNRTTNWRKNLYDLIQDFIDAYKKSPDFYDRLGGKEVVEPRPITHPNVSKKTLDGLIQRIIAIHGWDHNDFLSSLYEQVDRGRPLSEKQLGALEKFEKPNPSKSYQFSREELDGVLERLRDIYRAHKGDLRKQELVTSLANQVKEKRFLSAKQLALINTLESR